VAISEWRFRLLVFEHQRIYHQRRIPFQRSCLMTILFSVSIRFCICAQRKICVALNVVRRWRSSGCGIRAHNLSEGYEGRIVCIVDYGGLAPYIAF
jgi:hypothetical protein